MSELQYSQYSTVSNVITTIVYYNNNLKIPRIMLKALVSDHPLLFYHAVAKRAHPCKRPALVTTTFSDFRGGRLRERRLYFLCSRTSFCVLKFDKHAFLTFSTRGRVIERTSTKLVFEQ